MKTTVHCARAAWAAIWIFQLFVGGVAPAIAQRRKTDPQTNTQFQQDVQGGQTSANGQPIASTGQANIKVGAGGVSGTGSGGSQRRLESVQIGADTGDSGVPAAPTNPLDKRITVRTKDAPLATFLETISAQAKVNFVITEGLERKRITAFLQDLTVREALQIMLEMKGLTYTRIGRSNTYLVSARSSRAPNRITRIYTLNYISLVSNNSQTAGNQGLSIGGSSGSGLQSSGVGGGAGTASTGASGSAESGVGVLSILKSVLTKEGTVQVDPRTNALIVTDIPEVFPNIEQILAELDKKPPQIMIEAQIVEINSDRAQQLGLEWGGPDGQLASFTGGARDVTFPLNLPNNLSHTHFFNPISNIQSSLGSSSASSGASTVNNTGGTTNVTNPFSSLVIGSTLETGIFSLQSLQVVLRALVTRREARFLGKPKVLTLNNKTAQITIVQKQAIGLQNTATQLGGGSVGATSTTSAEREPTGLGLRVTPQVNKEGYITMLVEPNFVNAIQSQIGTTLDTVTRSASTMVRVKNGQTLVLGGLLSSTESKLVRKVPFLGYIPLIGWFFTSTSSQRSNTDLVIFITPTVVND